MLSVPAFRRLVRASAAQCAHDGLVRHPLLWRFIVAELAWGAAQSLPPRRSGGAREGGAHESLLR